MRVIYLVAALSVAAGAAPAQLAIQQPTEKVLVLPLQASPADSVFSIATADAARTRLETLAKYKAFIVPKTKLCESLGASGFHCDELLEPDEARALARALGIQAYTVGRLERVDGKPTAHVRIVDIASSGFARAFAITDPTATTPQELGEQIAQRMSAVIRAGEYARDCTSFRSKGQLPRAVAAANKALQQDPDLTGAHLCLMLTYEALRMPPDSQVAVAERALRGDPQNTTALATIAAAWLQRGDTVKAMEAREREWRANPRNKSLLLGLIQLKRLRKNMPDAMRLVEVGLTEFPADEQLGDIRTTLCIEAEQPCAVDALADQARRDGTKLRDTSFLKVAIGATQQHQRAKECREFAAAATTVAPRSTSFWKARGGCFEMATLRDSALWAYRRAADLDRSDLAGSLLVAKTIIDAAEYDTLRAKSFGVDSAGLLAHRRAFADHLDTARVYLDGALRSSDTTAQLNAAALMRSGGEKLVRAGAIDRAYQWLDATLRTVGDAYLQETVIAVPPNPATTGTRLVVATGTGARLPTVPFNATVKAIVAGTSTSLSPEIVRVTQVTGDALTVTRAQEGTTARSITAGDRLAPVPGLRDAIRTNASFWFGLASFPALPGMYQTVAKSKSCDQARDFNERLTRTRQALQVGRAVHEPTVQRYLETMTRFDAAMASVKAAFKCTNF